MAGNGDGERVRRTGLGYGAHCLRCPNALRNGLVARRGASRDRTQDLPDALLKGRTPHVEWQIEPERWRLDEADYLGH